MLENCQAEICSCVAESLRRMRRRERLESLRRLVGGGRLHLPPEDPPEFVAEEADEVQMPEALWPSLRENWGFVRTHYHVAEHRREDVYVLRLPPPFPAEDQVADLANIVLRHQDSACRVNVSLSFSLIPKKITSSKQMFVFYASRNTGIFEVMPLIRNSEDIERTIQEIRNMDIWEEMSERFLPTTKWKIHSFISMTVYVLKFMNGDKIY